MGGHIKKQQHPLHIRARQLLQHATVLENYGQFSPENIAIMRKIADFVYVPAQDVNRAMLEMRSALHSARARRRMAKATRKDDSVQQAEASLHSAP
jgi:hypothetical protein